VFISIGKRDYKVYIAPANFVKFNGKTRFLSCNSEGKAKTVSDCPFGTANFGETRGLADFVKKHSYSGASVEETVGKFHDNRTYKIYIADPREVVDDVIKKSHDYVVYDNEPKFPNIVEFFDSEQKIVQRGLKEIQDYFNRLFAKVPASARGMSSAEVRRKVAEKCAKIYDAAAEHIENKQNLESRIRSCYRFISDIELNVPLFKKELVKKESCLNNHMLNLQKKEKSLVMYKQKYDSCMNKSGTSHAEIEKIKEKIEHTEESIQKISKKIEVYSKRIEYLRRYIEEAPAKIAYHKENIPILEQKLLKAKELLQPIFNRLSLLYLKL
jgi:predicted RNase H-like nuclease (RuvC/YqgF family)